MKPPDGNAHIAAAAALGALTEVWRRGSGLLSREVADAAPGLLRGHAAEMASSPLGRDQVLSLALLTAADDLEGGRTPSATHDLALPDLAPDDDARQTVRSRVLLSGLMPTAAARRAAYELEQRHRPECAGDLELSARLTAEADLHQRLWDDPRLPGDDRTRLTMLFSVPQLLERAEGLRPRRGTEAHVPLDARAPRSLRGLLRVPLIGWG